jgi:hypothetical protein
MRPLVATADAGRPVEFADVPEPTATSDEAVIAVGAFGLNRGEDLGLMARRVGASASWKDFGADSLAAPPRLVPRCATDAMVAPRA